MLQEDNSRFTESVKAKKEQVTGTITQQIKVKDSLIEELTNKLKESTKVIQQVKQNNKKLKEDIQQVQTAANATFEAQLGDAKKQIEEQLSRQLNSTISEQLSRQFEERIMEAK
jgi:predicted transcriptional regulator